MSMFRGRQIDEHASLTVWLACPTERSDKKTGVQLQNEPCGRLHIRAINNDFHQYQRKTGDRNGRPSGKFWLSCWIAYTASIICRRLRRAKAMPSAPKPHIASEAGSGTGAARL